MKNKNRKTIAKNLPPGYYAQIVPLAHMHSTARKRAKLAAEKPIPCAKVRKPRAKAKKTAIVA